MSTPASPMTRPFWEATERRRLVRPVCPRCERSFFVPRFACPHCGSEEWMWQQSSGRGTVHSFTVVHRAPRPDLDVPYVVADVDVEEGWNMLTNLVDVDVDDLAVGMPVEVGWRRAADGRTLPVFAPVKGGQP